MNILRRQWYSSQLKFNLPYQEVLLKDQPSWMTIRAQLCMHEQAIDGKMQMCGFVDVRTAMPKNRPGPDEAYKLCHMWLKRLQTKTAALAMITQRRHTYARCAFRFNHSKCQTVSGERSNSCIKCYLLQPT